MSRAWTAAAALCLLASGCLAAPPPPADDVVPADPFERFGACTLTRSGVPLDCADPTEDARYLQVDPWDSAPDSWECLVSTKEFTYQDGAAWSFMKGRLPADGVPPGTSRDALGLEIDMLVDGEWDGFSRVSTQPNAPWFVWHLSGRAGFIPFYGTVAAPGETELETVVLPQPVFGPDAARPDEVSVAWLIDDDPSLNWTRSWPSAVARFGDEVRFFPAEERPFWDGPTERKSSAPHIDRAVAWFYINVTSSADGEGQSWNATWSGLRLLADVPRVDQRRASCDCGDTIHPDDPAETVRCST